MKYEKINYFNENFKLIIESLEEGSNTNRIVDQYVNIISEKIPTDFEKYYLPLYLSDINKIVSLAFKKADEISSLDPKLSIKIIDHLKVFTFLLKISLAYEERLRKYKSLVTASLLKDKNKDILDEWKEKITVLKKIKQKYNLKSIPYSLHEIFKSEVEILEFIKDLNIAKLNNLPLLGHEIKEEIANNLFELAIYYQDYDIIFSIELIEILLNIKVSSKLRDLVGEELFQAKYRLNSINKWCKDARNLIYRGYFDSEYIFIDKKTVEKAIKDCEIWESYLNSRENFFSTVQINFKL